MKRILILIGIIITTLTLRAQETPPPFNNDFKQLSTSSFYIHLPDSAIWQYKGVVFGWARLGRFKDIQDSLANYQKLPNTKITDCTITSNGDSITVSGGTYRINGTIYTAPTRVFPDIPYSPEGTQRYLTFVGTIGGVIDTLGGVADSIAILPPIAFNQADLGSVIVGSGSIGQPIVPTEVLTGGAITSLPTIGFNAGTNITAAQFIQNVFYQSQNPTLALSGGQTLEFRAAGTTNYTLNWNAGRQTGTQPLSTIIVAGISQTFTQPSAGFTVSGTQSVTVTNNTNQTFIGATTTVDSKTAGASTTFTYQKRRFWGRSASPTPNETIIESIVGGGSELSSAIRAKSNFIITASGINYVYYAYPVSYGLLTNIVVGGFDSIDSFTRTTVSVTNSLGYNENYYVYTSNNTFSANTPLITVN
jgi:hypothetical protein